MHSGATTKDDEAALAERLARLRLFNDTIALAVQALSEPKTFIEADQAARFIAQADRNLQSLPPADTDDDDDTPAPETTRQTLRAFAEHGQLRGAMAVDGGDAEAVLTRFAEAGIAVDALAIRLQRDGAQAFVKSWKTLLGRIADKSAALMLT